MKAADEGHTSWMWLYHRRWDKFEVMKRLQVVRMCTGAIQLRGEETRGEGGGDAPVDGGCVRGGGGDATMARGASKTAKGEVPAK